MGQEHPVNVTYSSDLTRSRLTSFFRMWLAIPHMVWMALWGYAAGLVIGWMFLVALFTGRTPPGAHAYVVRYLAYYTRVQAYSFYLSDRFPPFNGTDEYEVSMTVEAPEDYRQGRLGVFFRGILSIPAVIVAFAYFLGWGFVQVYAIIAILITGRIPAGAQAFGERMMTFVTRLNAYYYVLTDVKPARVPKGI